MPYIIYDTEGSGYIILRKIVLPDNSCYYIKMANCDKRDRAEQLVTLLIKEQKNKIENWVESNLVSKGAF
jgi:hypothetical protein